MKTPFVKKQVSKPVEAGECGTNKTGQTKYVY